MIRNKNRLESYIQHLNKHIELLNNNDGKRLTKKASDFESRIIDVLRCPFNQLIHRCENAGELLMGNNDDHIIMHNGLKVGIDSYYPELYVPMFIANKGVHEPEEEAHFGKVLKRIKSNSPVIIELGSYWAFYSMWFLQHHENGQAFMIEPDPERLKAGERNFSLNNLSGDWTQAKIGKEFLKLNTFVADKNIQHIDILHSDIQGAELEMLFDARQLFVDKKISFAFISTHSNEIHENCLEFFDDVGYHICYSANMDISKCYDGVIVASVTPEQFFSKNALKSPIQPNTNKAIIPTSNNHSQLGQDEWVLDILNNKNNGFFVEVGSSDGVYLSNTLLLETKFSWNGVCIEPSSEFENLKSNRECLKTNDVIFHSSNIEIDFIEDESLDDKKSFSGISDTLDKHQPKGKNHKRLTKTLTEVLDETNAPKQIDYLSINTEGSEYEVLCGIDFDKYNISLITVEHNWVEPKRTKIRDLLFKHGYQVDTLVDSQFDDWYIHNSILLNSENRYFEKANNQRRFIINNIGKLQTTQDNERKIELLNVQLQEKEKHIQEKEKHIQEKEKHIQEKDLRLRSQSIISIRIPNRLRLSNLLKLIRADRK